MALRLTLHDKKTDVLFQQAYARVGMFKGDKNSVQILVDVYSSQEAHIARATPLGTYTYTMPFNEITGELLPSIYFWLKQKKEFLEAQDC